MVKPRSDKSSTAIHEKISLALYMLEKILQWEIFWKVFFKDNLIEDDLPDFDLMYIFWLLFHFVAFPFEGVNLQSIME